MNLKQTILSTVISLSMLLFSGYSLFAAEQPGANQRKGLKLVTSKDAPVNNDDAAERATAAEEITAITAVEPTEPSRFYRLGAMVLKQLEEIKARYLNNTLANAPLENFLLQQIATNSRLIDLFVIYDVAIKKGGLNIREFDSINDRLAELDLTHGNYDLDSFHRRFAVADFLYNYYLALTESQDSAIKIAKAKIKLLATISAQLRQKADAENPRLLFGKYEEQPNIEQLNDALDFLGRINYLLEKTDNRTAQIIIENLVRELRENGEGTAWQQTLLSNGQQLPEAIASVASVKRGMIPIIGKKHALVVELAVTEKEAKKITTLSKVLEIIKRKEVEANSPLANPAVERQVAKTISALLLTARKDNRIKVPKELAKASLTEILQSSQLFAATSASGQTSRPPLLAKKLLKKIPLKVIAR